MGDETKEDQEENGSVCKHFVKSTLHWDISVNHNHITYSNGKRKITNLADGHTARGPFWKCCRHIIQIKVHEVGHVGIGIVTKAFSISNHWVGQDSNSYGIWDRDDCYIVHQDKRWGYNESNQYNRVKTRKLLVKKDDIVTVDLDLNDRTLNFAINGTYLSDQDLFENIASPVAVAASLWRKDDCVEIIDYQRI